MYDIEKFKEKLKSEVKESRYEHSLSVMNFSVELAKYYGVDEEKQGLQDFYTTVQNIKILIRYCKRQKNLI